jgi:hypothetical protein
MLRRLFFLFPDEKHAQRVVHELVNNNIPKRRIHAITHGGRFITLPKATERQKRDTTFRVEKLLWFANLLVFALAFLGLIMALISGEVFWSAAAIFVMLASFIAGELFVVYVPDVHLSEFTDALSHGEILLMVDVPKKQVAEVEHYVHRRHPEACVGGVGWTLDAFGI